jgi:polar amino acid transport system permease protein
MDFSFLGRYQTDILQAGLRTLYLSAETVTAGTILAVAFLPLRLSRSWALRWLGWGLLNPFRILPALVLLVWGFYGLPVLAGVRFSPWIVAVAALGLNMAGFCLEIFRAAVEEVSAEQVEAAQLLGMRRIKVIRTIVLPLAWRNALVPYLNQVLQTFKLTVLAALIGVPEIYQVTSDIIQQTNRPLEGYTALAVVTLVPLLLLTLVTEALERSGERQRRFTRWTWLPRPQE